MPSYALIADPDTAAALVFASAAKDEGLTYLSVRDGARALAVIRDRGAPELLVTEIALPDLDGLELVERIRRLPAGETTAVVTGPPFQDVSGGWPLSSRSGCSPCTRWA